MEHRQISPAERVSAPIALPGTIPPAPAVMRILDRFNRDELGNAIEVLVALLDVWDGDPDEEETDAEDAFITPPVLHGPGCPIGDPDFGIDDVPHDQEHDAEGEQLPNDVPMLEVRSPDGEDLGISNLQSSFMTNGSEVRSADTGALLVTRGWQREPGVPV